MILERFYPKEWRSNAYVIDWPGWRERGIRGVIFDIDNTLVPHGAPADERAIALFASLHGMGMRTCLLSNNQRARVESFAAQVSSLFIYKADKPSVKNYRQAMQRMETGPATTLFVGDQLFTDIYGANRAGIYGILVNPINPKEEIQIVLKRYLEAIVLHYYRKNGGILDET